jgi:hypothetical protein
MIVLGSQRIDHRRGKATVFWAISRSIAVAVKQQKTLNADLQHKTSHCRQIRSMKMQSKNCHSAINPV